MSHNVYIFQTNPSTQKHDFATTKKKTRELSSGDMKGNRSIFIFTSHINFLRERNEKEQSHSFDKDWFLLNIPKNPVIVIWADRYKRNTSTFTYPSYFMYIKFIEISRPWLPIQKMNTSFFRVPISLLCFQVQRVWKWLTKNCYLFLSFSLTWLSWDRDHIYL